MNSQHRSGATSHMIGGLFTFALFAMFVVLSLLIVVIGVDGYRGVVDASESVSQVRMSLGYVAGKMRSSAASDGVRLQTYDGGLRALVLTEKVEDGILETVIYHQDGQLYESYIDTEAVEFDAEFGTSLADIAEFEMVVEGPNLLRLTATTANGWTQTMRIALRGGQEVAERE